MPPRKPPGNRVQRTPEVQRERDRTIPRPLPGSGLRVASPNDWVAIWHEVAAKPPVKVTGYAILKFADYSDGADIRPGEDRLAVITQQTTRTVRSALWQMREWGLIWRYRQGSKHGRQQLADEYRLTMPDDLVTRVPLIVSVAALPDHRNEVPVFNPDHRNLLPLMDADHGNLVPVIGTDHRNLMHGSPESDDTDHRNDVPPTVISDPSTTSSSIGVPQSTADVEVPSATINGRSDSSAQRCGYARCRTPSSPTEPGQDYHPACEYLAKVKNLRTQPATAVPPSPYPADHLGEASNGRLPAMSADAPPEVTEFLNRFAASASYPDDFRDELPEDYEDGDHVA